MKKITCKIAIPLLALAWLAGHISAIIAGDAASESAKDSISIRLERYGSIRQAPQQTASRPTSAPVSAISDPSRLMRENYGSIGRSSRQAASRPVLLPGEGSMHILGRIRQENYGSIGQSSKHTTSRPADSRPVMILDPLRIQRENYGSIGHGGRADEK